MSIDTLALITTLVASAITATWVLRSGMAKIENGLNAHVVESNQKFESLTGRVIKLEGRSKRQR